MRNIPMSRKLRSGQDWLAVDWRSEPHTGARIAHFRTVKAAKMEGKVESVQVFGRKKNATAVAYCKRGHGLIKVNGTPIELVEPEILRVKTYEPVLLLGQQRFANVR